MDSEDDMHDANDVESLEDFYSGDTAIDSDDAADGDYEFIDNDSEDEYDDFTSHRNQVRLFHFRLNYCFLESLVIWNYYQCIFKIYV